MSAKKNSTIYETGRKQADTKHFVSPNVGNKGGDATYGKPCNGKWHAGGGSYDEREGTYQGG